MSVINVDIKVIFPVQCPITYYSFICAVQYYLNPILLCQNLFYILSYAIIVLIYKYVVTF